MFDAIHEKGLRAKAQRIHAQLTNAEVRYEQVRGKRLLQIDRAIIAVPIGQRYRLVYREMGGKLELLKCCTHETYNNFIEKFH